MPKHSLTFKHFLGAPARTEPARRDRERSVNELLNNSRQAQPVAPVIPTSAPPSDRERPPHWGDGDVHPAELLRREQVAHARAARAVAGPAPPRSWRQGREKVAPPPEKVEDAGFVAREMRVAAAFLAPDREAQQEPFDAPPPPTLVRMCVGVVIDTIEMRHSTAEHSAGEMAEAMLYAARELSVGLRGRILAESALRPLKLGDGAIRVLLDYERREGKAEGEEGDGNASPVKDTESTDTDADWDEDPAPTLSHLSLAGHPAPLRLLQDVPRLHALSLTSVDLAFATLPALDRVVAALPAALRALGLAGARSAEGYASWERGLSVLARKMNVLQVLDISHLPILPHPVLHALFSTPATLPSLRRLGMRGNLGRSGEGEGEGESLSRAMVKEAVNRGRRRWVDIAF